MKRFCDECNRTLGPRRKRFCSNRCKDTWHNWNNQRGKFAHLERLSPKSREAFCKERDDRRVYEDAMDSAQSGWDGHKS